MAAGRIGEVAVIFTNRRTGADEAGYAAAAADGRTRRRDAGLSRRSSA